MSKSVKYNGRPLAVFKDYKTDKYVIYDKGNKTWGAEYTSFQKAKDHAMGWNRIYRNAK